MPPNCAIIKNIQNLNTKEKRRCIHGKNQKISAQISTQLAGRTAGGAFLWRIFPDCGSIFWSAVCHDSLCHHGTVPDPPCPIQLLGLSVPAAGHLRSPCPFRHDCHVGYAPFSALEFHHSLCIGFPAIFTIRAKRIFCQRHDIRIPAIHAAGTKGLWRTAGSGAGLLGIPCHCTEAVSLFTAWQKAGKTYGSDVAYRTETAFSNAHPHC